MYLERARSHPTGKMWVETIIYPTFLAMKLVQAEREKYWLLLQDCLWRMLPLLFAAGHPLTSPSDHLYNIITGQVATADVNTHQTVELGTSMRDDFIASYPGGFHHISSNVKTMQSMKRTATVNNKPVYDLDAFLVECLSLVRSVIFQSPTCSTTSLLKSHHHS